MKNLSLIAAALVSAAVFGVSQPAGAADEKAAQSILKKDKCTTCHAVDRKKDGPSYKEVAEKYRGKADAEAKLTKHVTEPSMVEVDGKKEEHGNVSATDPEQIKNLVHWILSL